MKGRLLVDTGPIVAILVESDQYHEVCVETLRQIQTPLLTCWPVITEAAWLLREYPMALRRLLSSFRGLPFQLLPLGEPDLLAIDTILHKYRELGVQLADASLVHLANREGIDTIFTLDRRDFTVLRLRAWQEIADHPVRCPRQPKAGRPTLLRIRIRSPGPIAARQAAEAQRAHDGYFFYSLRKVSRASGSGTRRAYTHTPGP